MAGEEDLSVLADDDLFDHVDVVDRAVAAGRIGELEVMVRGGQGVGAICTALCHSRSPAAVDAYRRLVSWALAAGDRPTLLVVVEPALVRPDLVALDVVRLAQPALLQEDDVIDTLRHDSQQTAAKWGWGRRLWSPYLFDDLWLSGHLVARAWIADAPAVLPVDGLAWLLGCAHQAAVADPDRDPDPLVALAMASIARHGDEPALQAPLRFAADRLFRRTGSLALYAAIGASA